MRALQLNLCPLANLAARPFPIEEVTDNESGSPKQGGNRLKRFAHSWTDKQENRQPKDSQNEMASPLMNPITVEKSKTRKEYDQRDHRRLYRFVADKLQSR